MSQDYQFGELQAEIRHLHDMQRQHKETVAEKIKALRQTVISVRKDLSALEGSINRAVLYLALGAGAIIFHLLRNNIAF